MELRQIEYIIAIADEQSIARAAEKLYMTQSALNQQLLKLERELGIPLFERRKKRMIPTPAGELYLDTARHMVRMREDTYRRIHDIAEETSGEISIAFTPERGAWMFSEVYPVFRKAYPKVRMKTYEARNRVMEQLILNREVTIGCLSYLGHNQSKKFSYYSEAEEELLLALPASHPLAYLSTDQVPQGEKFPMIDLGVLRDESFVLHTIDTLTRSVEEEAFALAGYKPKELFQTGSSQVIQAMVSKQIAPGFLSRYYARPNIGAVYFRFRPFPSWTLTVTTLKNAYLTVAERCLVSLIDRYNTGLPLEEDAEKETSL